MSKIKEKIIKVIKRIKYLNKKINPSLLASSITFYLILTLIPFTELIYIFLGILKIIEIEKSIFSSTTILTSIIFIINLIITSSKLVHNLVLVSNEVYYDVEIKTNMIERVKSFVITIILLIMILILIILIFYLGYLKVTFFNELTFLINLFELLFTYIFISIFLSILYKLITPIKIKVKETIVPSFIITMVVYLILIVYQRLIKGILITKYITIYGGFSSVIVTLVFLYIEAYVFIIGICYLLYKNEYKEKTNNI